MSLSDLFRPKWRHSDPEVRVSAVFGLRDKAILRHVVLNDPDPQVRRTAVGNLADDQSLMAHVAENDTHPSVREIAATWLRNEEVLEHIARCDSDADVRRRAVKNIKEPQLLRSIAADDADDAVKFAAVEAINDLPTLLELAGYDSSGALSALGKALQSVDASHPIVCRTINMALSALPSCSGDVICRLAGGFRVFRKEPPIGCAEAASLVQTRFDGFREEVFYTLTACITGRPMSLPNHVSHGVEGWTLFSRSHSLLSGGEYSHGDDGFWYTVVFRESSSTYVSAQAFG